jgi:heat shock protein HslJ
MRGIVAFLAAALLAACSGPTGPAGELRPEPALLLGGTWRLQQVTLPWGVSVSAGAKLTASFGPEGRVGGAAGPNGYGATYVAGADGSIAVSDAISTLIGGPEAERAGAYLAAMLRATAFEVAGTELRLYSPGGGYLLFRRESSPAP